MRIKFRDNKKTGKKVIASWEMFLLVSFSFAVAFLISQEVGIVAATLSAADLVKEHELLKAEAAKANSVKLNMQPGATAKSSTWFGTGAGPKPYVVSGSQSGVQSWTIGSEEAAKTYSGAITNVEPIATGGAKVTFAEETNPVTLSSEQMANLQSAATAKGIGIQQAESYQIMGVGPNFIGWQAHLVQGMVWAAVAVAVIQIAGKLFGLEKGLTNSLSYSAVGGIAAYKTILALGPTGTGTLGPSSALLSAAPFIGIGIAAAIFIMTYKTEKKKTLTFQCLPWEAPIGGTDCEKCNEDKMRPCSEYRCKSLGQACEIVNAGTAIESCMWKNPKDVNSPTIRPTQPLTEKLKYVPDTTIRPPALGVKIIREGATGGCLQAYTPLKFSFETNEPSQCMIDYQHTTSMGNMSYYIGENSYYVYNHTQYMKLPGLDTGNSANGSAAPEIKNDGSYSFYVRCRDANGNENVDEFTFNLCVDKGPDTTPPVVDGSSINSGGFVQYNADSVPIDIYVNEPADCKWSRLDKAYDDMENTMSCATQTYQINSNLDYTCSGTLTGIKNSENNNFFFRCKDNPGKAEKDRNTATQSYPLILKGTNTLNIMKTSPNETIYGSTSTISVDLQVETANGAEQGKATCYFSNTGNIDSYTAMFETNSNVHKQSLDLTTGSYTYYFRCVDAGGNAAEANTKFSIFVDKQAPVITRIYREGSDALKVVTNEDAECSYSLTSCNFAIADGVKMLYPSADVKNVEISEWKPNVVYYIRCKDGFGNEPLSNTCSMTASAATIV